MDYVDLIFGAVLAFFVIIGFSKGLFREIFGLAGILGGVIAGIIFTGPLSDFFVDKAPAVPPVVIPIICFTFVFILVFLLSRMLANWLSSITRAIHLGWLNKLLGGIVGGLKGGLILSLLLLLISVFPIEPTIDSMRNKSYFYSPIEHLIPTLYNIFSPSTEGFDKKMRQWFREGEKQLKKHTIETFLDGGKDSSTTR